jgi:hypothetical protein
MVVQLLQADHEYVCSHHNSNLPAALLLQILPATPTATQGGVPLAPTLLEQTCEWLT